MRILTVTPYYWPAFSYGGPVFSLHYLNKALAKKNIDVSAYATNAGLGKNIPLNTQTSIDGVKVTYFKFSKLFEFFSGLDLKISLPMASALRKNLKFFDLVYISTIWSYSTVMAAHYSRLYEKTHILSPRGMLYREVFYKKAWKKWPYYNFAIKKVLKNASFIHYTTENEAKETHSFHCLKNPFIVIPNGLDLSEYSCLPGRQEFLHSYPGLKDKKIILFLGRINWKKGLDILVHSYAKLKRERDDLHLVIAGYGDKGFTAKIKRLISVLGIESEVTFTGMLTGSRKLEAYVASDIFVLPSYSENFGMTVVEAMACRCAVVISNKVGIYNEVAQNKAGIVTEANVDSVYKGIKQFLENPGLRQEAAVNGRKLVEEYYDIDKVADKMIEVYQGIRK